MAASYIVYRYCLTVRKTRCLPWLMVSVLHILKILLSVYEFSVLVKMTMMNYTKIACTVYRNGIDCIDGW